MLPKQHEVVPEDRQHPAYQLLVARLYNAGVKGLALQRHFQVDRKTMQRWGRALQSGEAQQLVQALAGRGGRRKLTPEIRAFVGVRFPEIYGQSRAGYSQRLRAGPRSNIRPGSQKRAQSMWFR